MADVSAVLHGGLTPEQIMWELPLFDGLMYQSQAWVNEGYALRKVGISGKSNVSKYLRNGRKN